MTINSRTISSRFPLLWATMAVVIALFLPFHGLLSPAEVMFANDGPFGMLKNHEQDGFDNFLGVWMSDNWIGMAQTGALPDLTHLLFYLFSAVVYAKILVPISLLFLGFSAAFFCWRSGFHPGVGIVIALGAALNSNPFSFACWGLAAQALNLAFVLMALGLLQGVKGNGWRTWCQVLLAGFCVGLNVMEGADVGAIFSLYVAAFVIWQAWVNGGSRASLLHGSLRLSVVALAAGWIASHGLFSLISTQIVGVSQPAGLANSAEAQWQFATSFSFPPSEVIRFFVPGILGYRMDTPDGGAYWGGFGPDGTPQNRFNGGGEYVGLLILILAIWGIASAFRGENSPLKKKERLWVFFWAVVAAGSLFLAFGRFEPSLLRIYRGLVALPYFSTIRGPYKFLHMMHLALWILAAYGLEALARSCFQVESKKLAAASTHLLEAYGELKPFDRGALKGLAGVIIAGGLAATLYTVNSVSIAHAIDSIPNWYGEKATAQFSIREVWIAWGFLAASGGLIAAAILGAFRGPRAAIGWFAFAVVVTSDLVRADIPWVKHYDYIKRHDFNPLMEKLSERPWEHRVTAFLRPQREGLLVMNQEFSYLSKEWLENHFQFFHIQSLDIDQMPRMPELESAYFSALTPPNFEIAMQMAVFGPQIGQLTVEQAKQVRAMVPEGRANLFYFTRLWQLTNTRYILGWRNGLDMFNDLFDPLARRFKVAMPYGLMQKVGAPSSDRPLSPADAAQWYTVKPDVQGQLALIEFTGALPRASLYTQWETVAADRELLSKLVSPTFDPSDTVLLSESVEGVKPTKDAVRGDVSFIQYSAKRVSLKTKAGTAQVLLLNDRWHEKWQVSIDGVPAKLLRANFIMRGVVVPAGEHTIEFQYRPPSSTLWVSLSAVAVGLGCLLALGMFSPRNHSS